MTSRLADHLDIEPTSIEPTSTSGSPSWSRPTIGGDFFSSQIAYLVTATKPSD